MMTAQDFLPCLKIIECLFISFQKLKDPPTGMGNGGEEKLLLHPGSSTGWWTIRLDLNITLILRPSVTPPRTQQRFLLHHEHRAKDGQIAKRRTHQLRSMESLTVWCSSRKWRGQRRRERERPVEREEHERKELEWAERLESRDGGQTCNWAAGEWIQG